ncbi:regulator of chromosome condensation 1/beta-lactamase-inhibitor protein II [Obelidium mucronatum]|nr:regulator of chromosome condensation 1/beta-lactamase-inhibitor protein II [Obelidium mucronatum]
MILSGVAKGYWGLYPTRNDTAVRSTPYIVSGWLDAYDLTPHGLANAVLVSEGLDDCVFIGIQGDWLVAMAVSQPSKLSLFTSPTASLNLQSNVATVALYHASGITSFACSNSNLALGLRSSKSIYEYQLCLIIRAVMDKLRNSTRDGAGDSSAQTLALDSSPMCMQDRICIGKNLRSEIVKMESGYSHFLALCKDGSVLSWSDASGNGGMHGQLGLGSMVMAKARKPESKEQASMDGSLLSHQWLNEGVQFIETLLGLNVTDISCGGNHSVAVVDSCFVYTFGSNSHGQLGRRTRKSDANYALPSPLDFDFGDSDVIVSCGDRHTIVANQQYSRGENERVLVWGFGDNEWGALTGVPNCSEGRANAMHLIRTPLALDFMSIDAASSETRGQRVRVCCGSWNTIISW